MADRDWKTAAEVDLAKDEDLAKRASPESAADFERQLRLADYAEDFATSATALAKRRPHSTELQLCLDKPTHGDPRHTLADFPESSRSIVTLHLAAIEEHERKIAELEETLASIVRGRAARTPRSHGARGPRRDDLGLGRAVSLIVERIRFHRGDGQTSWPMVVDYLSQYGWTRLGSNPAAARQRCKRAYARYVAYRERGGYRSGNSSKCPASALSKPKALDLT